MSVANQPYSQAPRNTAKPATNSGTESKLAAELRAAATNLEASAG